MRAAILFALAAFIYFDLALQPELASLSNQALCALLLAQVLVGTATLGLSSNGFTPFSFRFAYGVVFALFHFGLVGFMAIGLSIPEFMLVQGQWMMGQAFSMAIIVSTVGFLGYCLAAIAVAPRLEPTARNGHEVGSMSAFGPLGLVLVGASLGLWLFSAIQAGGVGILTGSYAAFLAATNGTYVGVAYFGLGLGMCLLPLGHGAVRKVGFVLFGLFALIAVPLGLRGEVMFPSVIGSSCCFGASAFELAT